jgi:hypothetical protein
VQRFEDTVLAGSGLLLQLEDRPLLPQSMVEPLL